MVEVYVKASCARNRLSPIGVVDTPVCRICATNECVPQLMRRPGAGRGPILTCLAKRPITWIPAFAGMTRHCCRTWIPAFAGMTPNAPPALLRRDDTNAPPALLRRDDN